MRTERLAIPSEGGPLGEEAAGELLRVWKGVPESQKGELIASLLDQTQGWHAYAISPRFALKWLETRFEKAGIEFPERIRSHASF